MVLSDPSTILAAWFTLLSYLVSFSDCRGSQPGHEPRLSSIRSPMARPPKARKKERPLGLRLRGQFLGVLGRALAFVGSRGRRPS